MLIVCTRNPVVVRTAQDPRSGSGQWGELVILNPQYNQAQATAAMERALRRADGPLCFSAHGNDTEIGDADGGWGWTTGELAQILEAGVPGSFAGPILIHACAETVSNFSAGLAVALERIRALNLVWCYGYNRPLPRDAGFPSPSGWTGTPRSRGRRCVISPARRPRRRRTPRSRPRRARAIARRSPSGYTLEFPQGFDLEEARRLLGLLAESPLR